MSVTSTDSTSIADAHGTVRDAEAIVDPASYAQEALWFLDRMLREKQTYNMPGAFEIRGPLDAEILRRVFEEIVGRHATLRTVFFEEDGHVARRPILPLISVAICYCVRRW